MKKLFILFSFLYSVSSVAQTVIPPQAINYQSIIRTTGGAILSLSPVTIEFKLYEGLSSTPIYHEKHVKTTTSLGMVNVEIGKGAPQPPYTTVSFENINWASGVEYEVFVGGIIIGVRVPFKSVPYALYTPIQKLKLDSVTQVLSSGPTSNSVTLPAGKTYYAGTGGIIIDASNFISNTAPDKIVAITPGNTNINITSAYPNFTVSSTPTLSLSGSNLSISNGNTVTIPSGTTYTGTSGNINVTTGVINLAPTTVIAGTYGNSSTNSIPTFSVDAFGRLQSATSFTPSIYGDVVGTINTSVVKKLNSVPLSAVTPTTNQVLSLISGSWTPTTLALPIFTTLSSAVAPNNNLNISSSGTSYTIGVPSYTLQNPSATNSLVINNGISSSSITLPSPTLSLASGTLSVGSNTINLLDANNGFWGLKGNAVATNTAAFIGTTDATTLVFKTNGTQRIEITPLGNIGVNVLNPTHKVHIINNSNVFAGLYAENSFATTTLTAHGVYGKSTNSHTLAAGVYGENTGNGPAIYGFKVGTTSIGNAGKFEINNTGNGADALFAKTNGTGFALHAVSSTSTNAGLFDGNVVVNGNVVINAPNTNELNRTQTGDANLVPIAYGNINSDGSININGTTANVSLSSHASSSGNYYYTITGESIFYLNYVMIATLNSTPGEISTSSASGLLAIQTYSSSGILTDKAFTFVIYKK